MNKTYLIAIAAALVAAPLALAHEPKGTYKNYCEPPAEWLVHEYGIIGLRVTGPHTLHIERVYFARNGNSGGTIQGFEDGNIMGDCRPGFNLGSPCYSLNPDHPFVGMCSARYIIDNYDGHSEHAGGGAWILVDTGNGEPADPTVGAGTLYCFGELGHHAYYPRVSVDDAALGHNVEVTIAADAVDLLGMGKGCGDFESDVAVVGIGTVTVTWPPGLDGSYQVYVRGSQGHITTD